MKKYILFLILFFAFSGFSYSKYWKEITNIPAPFNSNYWLDVFFHPSNPDYGWVCGFNGFVIRTTDGGNNWIGSRVPRLSATHLEHVHFPTLNVGYVSGPDGIYKSTNSGASWTEVTPDSAYQRLWGCYFLNENYGICVGGGCIDNLSFYKTTNGGASWSIFNNGDVYSGLSDVMLYPDGTGYASSSGIIWMTLDSGSTWNIHSITNSLIWQEEITNIGYSFLVPYAGNNCQGSMDGGGAKFSTDNGTTWINHFTNQRMFGSFLISPQTGWICGDNRTVEYTTDGGLNWKNKNCGLSDGDFDDIWFINPDNGWIVGHGVYTLKESEYTFSKDTIILDNVCLNQIGRDTVWISNISFDKTSAEIDLSPAANANFIENYNKFFDINECSYYPIILKYEAQKDTVITFSFTVKLNQGKPDFVQKEIFVILKTLVSTAYISKTDVVIDSIAVGDLFRYNVPMFSESNDEALINFTTLIKSNFINIISSPPLSLSKFGRDLEFELLLNDTGWVEAKYKIYFDRCNKDTTINIRAYGYSPIINAKNEFYKLTSCNKSIFDTIPISNSGNANLIISLLKNSPTSKDFEIIGFENENLPVSIKPRNSKNLIIKYTPTKIGIDTFKLEITNNDKTTIRGIQNPYFINLYYENKAPQITFIDEIDLGEVCVGKSNSLPLKFYNIGNLDGTVHIFKELINPFRFNFTSNSTNEICRINDSISANITFSPTIKGHFVDTLIFRVSPCDDLYKVIVKGDAISTEIFFNPPLIDTTIKIGDTLKAVIRINTVERDVLITNITLTNIDPNWIFIHKLPLPTLLVKDQAIFFEVLFVPLSNTPLNTKIVIENNAICDTLFYLDIKIRTNSTNVAVDPNIIDFGLNLCQINDIIHEIKITNTGDLADTLDKIFINSNEFNILNMPNLPYIIDGNDSLILKVKFNPLSEGDKKALLTIETALPDNQKFEIELFGKYYKSQIEIDKTIIDFGKIEHCEINKYDTFSIKNIGLIDDSLSYQIVGDNIFILHTYPNNNIKINKGEKVNFNIELLIDKLKYGKNELKILLKDLICNNTFEVIVKAELIEAKLKLKPENLNFGNLWIGRNKTLPLSIINENDFDIKIDKIELLSNDFVISSPIPQIIRANSEEIINITFSALSEGLKQEDIKIFYSSKCIDSMISQIIGFVDKEQYALALRMNDYKCKMDSSLVVPIYLDSVLKNIEPELININIKFDRNLFYPKDIKLGKNYNQNDIEYNYKSGNLNIIVSGETAKILFTEVGEIIYIYGHTFGAIPDSTGLVFEKVETNTNRNIDINLDHGSLKIIDYCEGTVIIGLQLIPTFETKINTINNQELNFSLKSTKDTKINFELINLNGIKTHIGIYDATTHLYNYKIDVSQFGSGLYFAIFRNEYWTKTFKIQIIK